MLMWAKAPETLSIVLFVYRIETLMPQYSYQNHRTTRYLFMHLLTCVCMGMSLSMSQRSTLDVIPLGKNGLFLACSLLTMLTGKPPSKSVSGSPTQGPQSHSYLKTRVLEPELTPSCLCGELFINCAVFPAHLCSLFMSTVSSTAKPHYLSTVRQTGMLSRTALSHSSRQKLEG